MIQSVQKICDYFEKGYLELTRPYCSFKYGQCNEECGLKPVDYKIFGELMKNSRISDRKLAKILGVSQPTVTRRRANLERKLIEGYTVVPKWEETEFKIVAFTFTKGRNEILRQGAFEEALDKVGKLLARQPNVVFASVGEGLGFDGVMISFHRTYSDFMRFKRKNDIELSEILAGSQSFLVDINSKNVQKRFNLKYLADAL